jgi:glycosyltransferase involved in cell wall biosynthesis
MQPRPVRSAEGTTPTLSLIIAAHNERGSIGEKLENSLALDYPRDRLEILVASDGSDDGTEEIVRTFEDRGVRLLALGRVGKASALNAAVAATTGEILVFSDANSEYEPAALRALVRPLADPTVGGVAGNQRYRRGPTGDPAAEGERAYWSFDRLMKEAESRAGSTISATGAIYAVRRELFDGVPAGVTDDFAVSTAVIERGYRLVFAADAVAWESLSRTGGVEWGRKVRVITRGLRGVWLRRRLLDPRRHGFYAVQLLTHKVLRRLMGVPLILMAVVAPTLWSAGWPYRLAAVAHWGTAAAGAAGLVLGHRGRRPKALGAPAFFLMANAAALKAAWNVLRGHRIDRWVPVRDADPAVAAGHSVDASDSGGR